MPLSPLLLGPLLVCREARPALRRCSRSAGWLQSMIILSPAHPCAAWRGRALEVAQRDSATWLHSLMSSPPGRARLIFSSMPRQRRWTTSGRSTTPGSPVALAGTVWPRRSRPGCAHHWSPSLRQKEAAMPRPADPGLGLRQPPWSSLCCRNRNYRACVTVGDGNGQGAEGLQWCQQSSTCLQTLQGIGGPHSCLLPPASQASSICFQSGCCAVGPGGWIAGTWLCACTPSLLCHQPCKNCPCVGSGCQGCRFCLCQPWRLPTWLEGVCPTTVPSPRVFPAVLGSLLCRGAGKAPVGKLAMGRGQWDHCRAGLPGAVSSGVRELILGSSPERAHRGVGCGSGLVWGCGALCL